MNVNGFPFALTVFVVYLAITGALIWFGNRLDRRYRGKHRRKEP